MTKKIRFKKKYIKTTLFAVAPLTVLTTSTSSAPKSTEKTTTESSNKAPEKTTSPINKVVQKRNRVTVATDETKSFR